ncbi:hypothetical protein L2E82_08083 [Cichorium intybus]|uniref:Uncharacterized protein n=1 Tax=Cichorium intybus TaxID=13427 RepID=A0ACB9G6L8_CICIN|nr:hypothetical protein L2E82_08083 [Cichorium intybus]
MLDTNALVKDFLNKLKRRRVLIIRKIEGSKAIAKVTAELLPSVISQQRLPNTNQAGALIDAIKAIGEQLVAANPVELAVGNIVRRVEDQNRYETSNKKPKHEGHILAKELISRGLQTTVITDSAVFAMISRVNMVIVGAHAVMANGGVIAPVGLNMVALAAQRHAVPFVVLAGIHKNEKN